MKPTNAPDHRFLDAYQGRKSMEKARWPNGPVCPLGHGPTDVKVVRGRREGLYRCSCGKEFTVTTGTFMRHTHVSLNFWYEAFALVVAGATAKELKDKLRSEKNGDPVEISYTSAAGIRRKIKAALRTGELQYAAKKWKIIPKVDLR
jgi:hypothetical protein